MFSVFAHFSTYKKVTDIWKAEVHSGKSMESIGIGPVKQNVWV